MKKIFIIGLIGFGIWTYLKNEGAESSGALPTTAESQDFTATETIESKFSCDGRQYCSQMSSIEEAEYFVGHCPDTKMDGDQDGIPCENDSRF
ncbi:MAG TPA: excalibur calcium-binding domain-containing protein [Methylophilaceae bacterium]|nr:excalibur calcium-binding domain-containing protein [Methylophilaceae bacterium]